MFALISSACTDSLFANRWYAYVIILLAVVPVTATLILIARQPTSDTKLTFAVPFVPWIPGISILINIYLITMLDAMTWIRFTVWIIFGLIIYLTYSIKKSLEKKRIQQMQFEQAIKEHDGSALFATSRDILVLTGQ